MTNTPWNKFLILYILSYSVHQLRAQQVGRDRDRLIKDQLLASHYDGRIYPAGETETDPVVVRVGMNILDINNLDDQKMTLTTTVQMLLSWKDDRLIYSSFPPDSGPDFVEIGQGHIKNMWVPRLSVEDSVEIKQNDNQKYARIHTKTGSVEYKYTMTLTTRCKMSFRKYPLDTQRCPIKLYKYGISDSTLLLEWDWEKNSMQNPDAYLGYSLQNFQYGVFELENANGNQTVLEVLLEFRRQCGYHLTQVFIPCTMLVIISWLSYWLHPVNQALPRLLISITALALLVNGAANYNYHSDSPRTTYTRAIDVWTGISLTLVFVSLIEFVIVNYLSENACNSNVCKRRKHNVEGLDNAESVEQQAPLNPDDSKLEPSHENSENSDSKHFVMKCDWAMRFGIPILFLGFVIVYWLVYSLL